MRFYLRTNMKLSTATREAWQLAGFERIPFFAVGSAAGGWAQRLEPDSLVLNYGCSQALYAHDGPVLNSPSLVHRTRVEELPNHVGEYMPIVKLDINIIVKQNGRKGRGKVVVAPDQPVVVQRFLYPAQEFRVITWDVPDRSPAEVLAWSEKICDDPMDPQSYKLFEYRPTYDISDDLRYMLLDAHAQLGLNFVGWDVLLHEGEYWIIEANSAPGIGEQTARRLRKRLRSIFSERLELAA